MKFSNSFFSLLAQSEIKMMSIIRIEENKHFFILINFLNLIYNVDKLGYKVIY